MCLTTVRFVGESKREKKQAVRMDRFYLALERAVYAWAEQCYRANGHSHYRCTICATEQKGEIVVSVTLMHRMPGVVSHRRTMRHIWQKGLLIHAENDL